MSNKVDDVTGKLIADHVIQITIVPKPKRTNILGNFMVWKKRGLFGVSDETLGFCPEAGCLGVISQRPKLSKEDEELIAKYPGDFSAWPPEVRERALAQFGTEVVCPVCLARGSRGSLPDSYVFNMGPDRIAVRAEQLLVQLQMNADILLVRPVVTDGLVGAREYLYSANRSLAKYADKLESARERETVLYLMDNLLKDISAGSTAAARIRSLIGG